MVAGETTENTYPRVSDEAAIDAHANCEIRELRHIGGGAKQVRFTAGLPVVGRLQQSPMNSLHCQAISLRSVAALLWCGLVSASSQAVADIYAYVDSAGVVHYTNVPVDDGFEMILDGPPDTAAEGDAKASGVPIDAINRRAAAFEAHIREAAAANSLDPELLRAVISVESAFNPRAVSTAGARGLMQLMPQTARRYGVRDSFDPRQNIHGGARYLRYLIEHFANDLELVVAAYNAGEAAVERYGRRIPPYRETRQYVPRVLDRYRALVASR